MVKKILKKVVKKVKDAIVIEPTHNEYGTCIACQGGRTECLHNNQVQDGQSVVCITCGFKVK